LNSLQETEKELFSGQLRFNSRSQKVYFYGIFL